jgi:hypothetical protein
MKENKVSSLGNTTKVDGDDTAPINIGVQGDNDTSELMHQV